MIKTNLGQYKIKKSKVLVIGAGGLGSTVLLYLCAMGVGKIGVVDFDSVESSNLHRQIIHKENTAGLPKVESAKRAMNELNSRCEVETYNTHLNSSNALEIFEKYDIVVDASDNLPTRYLINDACVITKKPLVYGSALRLDGQVVKYNYKGGPCYRCMFPKPPPFDKKASCSEAGVLGVVPGLIGCIQALEVIKIVLSADSPQPTSSYMLSFSTYGNPQFRQFRIRNRRPDCEVCGESPTITSLIDYPAFCGADSTDMVSEFSI
ncbi:Adenylyltransferase and sulfurtransferase MOCS3 [Zancudomyces culisetae]|uniref:Adenylyltransferase and sulfurtransferase MOCS3 n=1 Tax=Zancudomyces culisetae TaxID=1213189 RepID=A0A1R1PGP4_ZANCU|nr:Adenylyltransferase and sulfurtransferase MOCS3 [Zancudomyces culisetae]|eukprot:OMH80083.1 Adenylyltransferase and sulfurtransferase MOCS3 [Zancudomyces culisetae]